MALPDTLHPWKMWIPKIFQMAIETSAVVYQIVEATSYVRRVCKPFDNFSFSFCFLVQRFSWVSVLLSKLLKLWNILHEQKFNHFLIWDKSLEHFWKIADPDAIIFIDTVFSAYKVLKKIYLRRNNFWKFYSIILKSFDSLENLWKQGLFVRCQMALVSVTEVWCLFLVNHKARKIKWKGSMFLNNIFCMNDYWYNLCVFLNIICQHHD